MVLMFACGTIETTSDSKYSEANTPTIDESLNIEEGQSYTEAQDLVDYLEMYGELPPNFITKKKHVS